MDIREIPQLRKNHFSYVNIVGKGCEGWLNLFFADEIIAMVSNKAIAKEIRKDIPEKYKAFGEQPRKLSNRKKAR